MYVVAVTVRDTIWRQDDNRRNNNPAIKGRMGGEHPVIHTHNSLGSSGDRPGWRMRDEGTGKRKGFLMRRIRPEGRLGSRLSESSLGVKEGYDWYRDHTAPGRGTLIDSHRAREEHATQSDHTQQSSLVSTQRHRE